MGGKCLFGNGSCCVTVVMARSTHDPIKIARHWYLDILSGPADSNPDPMEPYFSESDDLIGQIFSPDYVNNVLPAPKGGWKRGVEGARQVLRMYRGASPDLRIQIDKQWVEGNKVMTRYTVTATHTGRAFFGKKANGKRYSVTGQHTDVIENGKFVESSGGWDVENLAAQMGIPKEAAVLGG